jgi:hypothetical protein
MDAAVATTITSATALFAQSGPVYILRQHSHCSKPSTPTKPPVSQSHVQAVEIEVKTPKTCRQQAWWKWNMKIYLVAQDQDTTILCT